MSKFDVHKWNRMRRLAEIDDRLYTGQSTERQEQALEDLANAIEELEMSGVFDDGNKMAEFLLELFSEEIPANLQSNARINLLTSFKRFFEKENIIYKGKSINFHVFI